MSKNSLLCASVLVAGSLLLTGCGGSPGVTPSGNLSVKSPAVDPASGEPAHPDLSHDHEHPDPTVLRGAPEWQRPLMPAFEAAAETYDVPLDLLLVLGKLGSGLENRGNVPTMEGGYGVMALRDNELTGDSLVLAAGSLNVSTDDLIRDPALGIAGAAAALDLYANRAGVDREAGIEAWLPAVISYAGLDGEDSRFFAVSVYELLQVGIDYVNSYGERFVVAPRPIDLDLDALVPPGVKRLTLEELEAGFDPDAPKDGPDPRTMATPDYPGAIWDPAASCNYTATVTSKDTIVVHTIEGTAAGARSWFKNCNAQVSAHYVISEAGTVWQMVEERYRAWHAGCYNSRAVGLEHEGYAGSSSHPVTLYNASALLSRNICDRRGIPKQKTTVGPGIIGHIDVTNCCCGTHWDPGNGWDWGYYIGQVVGTPALDSAYNAQSYQSTMVAGSTAIVWVEYRNTGSSTWQMGGSNPVHLGTWNPQDRSSAFYTPGNWLGPNRPTEMDVSTCAPNQVCRFTFIMTAPSTPGVYTEYWRLVKEGVAWFGYSGVYFQITVTAPQNNASHVSNTIPTTMTVGQSTSVSVTVQNTGDTTWTKAAGYKLGGVGDSDPFAAARQELGDSDSIAPGQQKTFTFTFTAPSTPGTYTTDWQMLREGVQWFGGVLSKNVQVTVPPPTITQHPSPQTVCPGGNASFSVTASGTGLSYQWQKNSANLSNGGHYSGVTTATLTVSGVDGSDAANYRCVVSNAGGSATSNQAALTVRAATTISQHPSPQSVCPGGTATFSVTASGDGTLTYQWQKDTVNLSGATSSTLQISNASAGDAGSYRCVVTGGCGSTTSNAATLTVNATTAITQHPQPQSVNAFGTASFSVTATGSGLSYQWQKDGVNLSDGGHVSGATTASLQISPATPDDVGDYRCVVTGTCGSATSNIAALTILAILADDFEAYAGQAAFESVWLDTANSAYFLEGGFGNPGKSVSMPSPAANSLGRYYRSLGAKYTGSDATPLILSLDFYLDPAGAPNWSGARHYVELRGHSGTAFGAGAIENLVAIGVHNSSSDTFSTTRYQGRVVNGSNWNTLDEGSAPSRQSGWHQLKAEIGGTFVKFYIDGVLSETESRPNSYGFDWVVLGSDLTANGHAAGMDNVVVSGGIPLPEFTTHPASQTVCSGANVSFGVAASGSGTLAYRWARDGADLSDGSGVSGAATANLLLTGVDAGDAGNYTCRVTNADGSVTSNAAALALYAAAAITQQPAPQNVCPGGVATFTVAASGQAPLAYQWQKNGVDVSGATSATLQLTGVGPGDVAGYRCVVTDACLTSATSDEAALTLNAAPAIAGSDPVALEVAKNSTCGAPNEISLSASDPDTAAGSLTWTIAAAPASGTADFVGGSNGASVTICYTPDLDQLSADSFVVQVSDGCGGQDTVTVNVTVDACPNLLIDAFGGYASQSAFEGVWFDTANSAYYIDTINGWVTMPSPSANSLGRYYRNLGGDFNGTDANPLVMNLDFYLDPAGAPNWSGARHYVELRGYSGDAYNSGTLENLLAIGVHNTSNDTWSTTRYQGRVTFGANWQTLDEGSAPVRQSGWHQLRIEVTSSQVRFYVDGVLSETESRPNALGFDSVVIGSDLTANGHLAAVDNLTITCGP